MWDANVHTAVVVHRCRLQLCRIPLTQMSLRRKLSTRTPHMCGQVKFHQALALPQEVCVLRHLASYTFEE